MWAGVLAGVVVGGALAGLAVATGWPDAGDEGEVLVASARFPSALVALPDGGLLYAERLSGQVRSVDPDGGLDPEAVAEVDVVAGDGDQRGLLGLAVDDGGRLFASWTEPGGRLVVGELSSGDEPRLVWEGPESTDQANGGRLVFLRDGGLAIGIGDLLDQSLVDDPSAVNGKLLVLDPDGDADQEPTVLSGGWNNPFAYGLTPSGQLWVADNSPGERAERLARGDVGGAPSEVTELEGRSAPSGLAALSDDRLAVCGYGSGDLRVFDVGSTPARVVDTVDGCSLGVAVLADGRLALAEQDTIRVVDAPG